MLLGLTREQIARLDAPQVAASLRQLLDSQELGRDAGHSFFAATADEKYPPLAGELEPHRIAMRVVDVDEIDQETPVSRWLITVTPLPLENT